MLLLTVLLFITLSKSEGAYSNTKCNEFQANFNLKSVIGSWYVVAIIPEKLFPDQQHIRCYRVDFSETDEAGLRWLVNHTSPRSIKSETNLTNQIKGTIIRQHYNSEHQFDVWSKSVEGVNGCFQQVLSKDADKSDFNKAVTNNAMMQLHFLDSDDGSEPFLLQMLWGKLISAVIYRRHQGVTQDQLKPAFELMNKLRGPPRTPKICDVSLYDLLDIMET